jgi:hypothetical protein
MDGIKVTCQCGRILTAPITHAGKKGKCPSCGAHFIIPSPNQTAPPPPLSQPETAYPVPNVRKPFPTKAVAISGGALAFVAGIVIAAILLFSAPKIKITETSLGKMKEGIIDVTLHASPDSKRVAYVAKRGEKNLVVVDGVEGKEYDGISGGALVFSPNSKRVAYRAKRGDKSFFVVDGVEGKEYDDVADFSLVFSPDSKRVAYVAKRGEKNLAVVDGVEGQEYDGIRVWGVVIGFDGKILGYSSLQLGVEGGMPMVLAGVEGKDYGGAAGPFFSPDSQRVAYLARRHGKWFVVVDGVEGKKYDGIGWFLHFSPDSKRVAYFAKRGEEYLVVVDGVEGKEYDDVAWRPWPWFSPDSKRVAYVAERGKKWFVVVDGVEVMEKVYDEFHIEGSSLVFDSPTKFHGLAKRDNEIFLVEIEITE